ncbi:MAG: phosphoribosylanthranilate isomerase [Nitrospira sp.]|nr:phosphoribosylanthranilate isomerase [Nitrospira sp.]HBP88023.1 phosphoribosylanthranilate isomerase [Nitrospiraceae bacterium]HNP27694.1 phosphoribosylanthranilate isomerase [Nitrospirales bacterium]
MTPKIKICGITNQEDADIAVQEGADALGFVFYAQSPRYVQPVVAQHIIAGLPPFVLPVGVFVNHDLNMVKQVFDDCGLAFAQLHGDESPGFCEALQRPVLRAIRLRDRSSFLALAEWKGRIGVRGFVLDAFSTTAYGGTGDTSDWSLAAEVAKVAPILLAGGLTSENVEGAIRQVRPYGVDVSSGVELSPGRKDPAKIRDFIQSVRLVC